MIRIGSILLVFYLLCLSKLAVSQSYDFIVAADGSGGFTSVQAAFNAVPDFRQKQTTIYIKKGIYKEKLILATSKTNVKLIGEDVKETILTYDDYASKLNPFGEAIGTTGSSSFFVFADDFTADNITFENSAGPVGQAVAVRISGDRVRFTNCRFLGFQDTLYAHGEQSKQYYKNCYIEGTVDFIFGWSTAVFDSCTVFVKRGGMYITAASTLEGQKHGFVFLNCTLTGEAPEQSIYLGRPWRPFAKTVLINCFLDTCIKPEGWHNWNKPDAERTSYYAESNSRGPGANSSRRVSWAHALTEQELAAYTLPNILGEDWWKE